jgi:transposase-like protein
MEEENYPNNFEKFVDQFQTEKDCIEYISLLRWPDGYKCPHCESSKAWITSRDLFHCSKCRRDTSITYGTVFENTQKPLRLWFHVMWLMMAQKTGVSAKNLQDSMGFGSYQTIWGWLHKLRSIMVRPGRELLNGTVEVDETYIGGKTEGKRGRGSEEKTLVVVAVEGIDNIVEKENEKGYEKILGRVRFRCIDNASAENLIPFVCDTVKPGSNVVTDGWAGYNDLNSKGFVHCKQMISDNNKTHEPLPHVHLIVSLLKRWLRGTHQGAISSSHLQDYLDEYAFRFNRRLSTHRGKLFYRLMQQAVNNRAPAIKELYKI